MKIMKKQVIKE